MDKSTHAVAVQFPDHPPVVLAFVEQQAFVFVNGRWHRLPEGFPGHSKNHFIVEYGRSLTFDPDTLQPQTQVHLLALSGDDDGTHVCHMTVRLRDEAEEGGVEVSFEDSEKWKDSVGSGAKAQPMLEDRDGVDCVVITGGNLNPRGVVFYDPWEKQVLMNVEDAFPADMVGHAFHRVKHDAKEAEEARFVLVDQKGGTAELFVNRELKVRCEPWPEAENPPWRQMRSGVATLCLEERYLVLMGGRLEPKGELTDEVWVCDTKHRQWQASVPLDDPLADACAVQRGGVVLLLGGQREKVVKLGAEAPLQHVEVPAALSVPALNPAWRTATEVRECIADELHFPPQVVERFEKEGVDGLSLSEALRGGYREKVFGMNRAQFARLTQVTARLMHKYLVPQLQAKCKGDFRSVVDHWVRVSKVPVILELRVLMLRFFVGDVTASFVMRNPAVIIAGISRFHDLPDLPSVEKDVRKLKAVFEEELGLQVFANDPRETDDYQQFLRQAGNSVGRDLGRAHRPDRTSFDGMIVVLCGHGEGENLVNSEGKHKPLARVISMLERSIHNRAKHIYELPRVYFVDACRGNPSTSQKQEDVASQSFRGGGARDDGEVAPDARRLVIQWSDKTNAIGDRPGGGVLVQALVNAVRTSKAKEQVPLHRVVQHVGSALRKFVKMSGMSERVYLQKPQRGPFADDEETKTALTTTRSNNGFYVSTNGKWLQIFSEKTPSGSWFGRFWDTDLAVAGFQKPVQVEQATSVVESLLQQEKPQLQKDGLLLIGGKYKLQLKSTSEYRMKNPLVILVGISKYEAQSSDEKKSDTYCDLPGVDESRKLVRQLCEKFFGYRLMELPDKLTKKELTAQLITLGRDVGDWDRHDGLIVFLCGHGAENRDELVMSDGQSVSLQWLCRTVEGSILEECPRAALWPSIYFVDACRGEGSTNQYEDSKTEPDPDVHQDLNRGIVHGSTRGHRNGDKERGGLLLKALFHALLGMNIEQLKKVPLSLLLSHVRRLLALQLQTSTFDSTLIYDRVLLCKHDDG